MISWFRPPWGQPDLDRFLGELSPYHPGDDYQPIDKYRDFRALFLGSDLGRRVLWELFKWCRLYRTSMNSDTHMTAFNEGKRDIGLQLIGVMNAEPSEPQTTTQREEPNG